MRPNAKTTRKNAKRSPGAAARQNEGTIVRAFRGARSEIRAHAKAVRAEREAQHADRMDACAEAAAVTLPAETIVAAATPDARPVVTSKPTRKPAKLTLTSRAKMGAARKPRKAAEPKPDTLAALRASVEQLDAGPVAEAKETLATATAAAEKIAIDWSALPEHISREAADVIVAMLTNGAEATSRELVTATGITKGHDRIAVDRVVEKQGFRLKGRDNPEADPADRLTRKLWRYEPVA
jgi:hypothetical protein